MKLFYLYCRKYAGIVKHNHVCLKTPTAGGMEQSPPTGMSDVLKPSPALSDESAQKRCKKTKSCGFTGSCVPDSVLGWA